MKIRMTGAMAAIAMLALLPASQAPAQDNTIGGAIIGGGIGAMIGGATTAAIAAYRGTTATRPNGKRAASRPPSL